jgi:hypothetical protein
MKLIRWILIATISLMGLVSVGEASVAIDVRIELSPGQLHTFNHSCVDLYGDSGALFDSGAFELTKSGSAGGVVYDNVIATVADVLSVSAFTVDGTSSAMRYTPSLINTVISLTDPTAGVYKLKFVDAADSAFVVAYDVALSDINLGADAWLLGSALLGFVMYSSRYRV